MTVVRVTLVPPSPPDNPTQASWHLPLCCIWGGELCVLGQGHWLMVTLLLRPSFSPLVPLHTQGPPSSHLRPPRTQSLCSGALRFYPCCFLLPGPPAPHAHRPYRQLQVWLWSSALMPPPKDPSSAPVLLSGRPLYQAHVQWVIRLLWLCDAVSSVSR